MWVQGVLNAWVSIHTSGYVHEGRCANDQNRSHTMFHLAWAYHLYLVAADVLPEI